MMTKKQYTLKSCKSYVISPTANSLTLLTPATISKSPRTTFKRSILQSFLLCLTLFGIALALLSCSALDTAAKVIMLRSEESQKAPTPEDLPWISAAPIAPIAFSIYVLPSLLDSLESESAKRTFTSTSTNQKNQE